MAKIFISYRRTDSAAYAGRLFDRLRSRYGDAEVFMDLEGIEPGAEFGKVVTDMAGAARVLIALIGRDWATLTNAGGRRRLDDPEDLVVREIEAGLNANARVIPVLAGRATMPAKHELPARIAALADRNAIELTDQRFHADMDRLIEVIDRAVPGGRPPRRNRWPLGGGAAFAAVALTASLLRPGGAPAPARPKPVAHNKGTMAEAAAAAMAASSSPPSWEQIRTLPVLYSESFDRATMLDVWTPQSPPKPPWTEEVKAGRWCATNRTDDSAINYVHVGVDNKELTDAPVFVRMTADAQNPTPVSGGGLLYRFDSAARTYYAFVLSPGGQATFWRRDRQGMSKLYTGSVPRSAPGQPTTIGVVGRGARFYLFADDTLLATVEDADLPSGRTGVVVLSKGRFCFDDFTVRGAS